MDLGTTDAALLVGFLITLIFGFKLFSKNDSASSSSPTPETKTTTSNKVESTNGLLPMKIFFGSQSGTAEDYSQELASEAKKYGFEAEVVDLEDYDPDDLGTESLAVFLMATFGEGEPTDNAVSFMQWVQAEDERDEKYFQDIPFAVFALGNRQYEHFCNIGINLDTILHKFGGKRICEHGEGDDDACLEDDFAEWRTAFWTGARKHFGFSGDVSSNEPVFTPAWTFKVVAQDAAESDVKYNSEAALLKDPKYTAFWVPVTVRQELRQDTSDGSTVHVEMDISQHRRLRYTTADNLGVFARNDFKQAAQLCKRLKGNPNMLFSLRKQSDSSKFSYPSPCSLQDAFLWYVDFNNTPRQKILKILADYAENDDEKAQLLRYAGEDKEVFAHDRKSLFEVMFEFPSVCIPMEHFLEFCPKMQPRFYTISSSSKVQPDQISITSSLLAANNPRDRVFKGVCTHYLDSLRPGKDKVCVVVRSSTFRLPRQIAKTPVIMVGPGTGLAPFRAFVQEFQHLQDTEGVTVNSTLFFGCKKESSDFIYKEELQKAEACGALTKLHLAFSRETDEKVYVQHRLREHGEDVWHLIDQQKAHFYVCGATSMGRSVKEVVVDLAVQHGGHSAAQAAKYVEKMASTGRYVQELWS